MNVEGLKLIGIGRQAEVYAKSDTVCIKLFYPDCSEWTANEEAKRMKLVMSSGVPSPKFLGLEKIDGRYAIIMERLRGKTLLHEALENFNPKLDYGEMLGKLQREYHKVSASGLSDMNDSLKWQINHADELDESEKAELIRRLEMMPRGDRLVHMDYHSDNVILTENGLKIIDWASACAGNPYADAARTMLTMQNSAYPADADDNEEMKKWLDETREACRLGYLRGYGEPESEIARWTPIIAASRLCCCPEDEKGQNLKRARDCLREEA